MSTMAEHQIINASFEVTSGAVCFGALPDILQGSAAPIQPPPNPRPRVSGTVTMHPLEYNVPAAKGTWNAYTLLQMEASQVEGWFAAHQNVDPLPELLKILRVSGSPYETDSGHTENNDETRAERVLLINRYDWGMDHDMIPDVNEDDFMAYGNTIGLVDHAHGNSYVEKWTQQKPKERGSSENGIWMYIPHPEYMWGRFGFNDEYTEARSFLCFTQRTDFYNTRFPGQPQGLREHETSLQRFRRMIREGKDFSGIDDLSARSTPPPPELRGDSWSVEQPPPESERVGPYSVNDHLLREEDIEAIRASIPPIRDWFKEYLLNRGYTLEDIENRARREEMAVLVDPWKEPIIDLLNELIMSYLERFVLPLRSHGTSSEFAPGLFPSLNSTDADSSRKHIDSWLLKRFTEGPASPTPGLDGVSVLARIKEFLDRRAGSQPVAFDRPCIVGIGRVVVALVADVLESASKNYAYGRDDSWRAAGEKCVITPRSIRLGVYNGDGILGLLRYSAVFWTGRP
ncbi:hypothetical protein B0J13DRAFT_577899 [Dactylonectria estremocensis]|uniref:Uncharacterized protein n=1 Tax=Dactylonectria estremocensis TaxID=1079267 RepID=A0A9P9D0K4_9HYPO|nr:hypothetical protein B0J13DRAFT_577899 [Dactylonectria estremocensis]